jgi:alkylhydroperoxidase family enzyme
MLAALPQNNVFRALAHADAAFPPLMELTASLWNDAVLGQRQRELAILRTARLVDSAYEWMHHIDVGRLELAPFAEADRLLLEAVPYILDHRRSEDHVFDALRGHFSLRELVELHLVVGLYATIAGVVTDFDVELEPRSGAFELQHDARGPRLGG